jgi:cell division protein FtsB
MTTFLRRLVFGAGLFVAGAFAVVHLSGPQGISALTERRRAIQALELDNKALREANATMRKWNEQLETDEDLQRLILQERYNMLPDNMKEFRTPPTRKTEPDKGQ